jgi:hypothetical protein
MAAGIEHPERIELEVGHGVTRRRAGIYGSNTLKILNENEEFQGVAAAASLHGNAPFAFHRR